MPTVSGWQKLNQLLLECGSVHEPHEFCVAVLDQMPLIARYDIGRLFFLNARGYVYDQYLVGITQRDAAAYHDLYADVDGGQYSVERRARGYADGLVTAFRNDESDYPMPKNRVVLTDFESEGHDTRFYREYAARLGIRYACGFGFIGPQGKTRAAFSLERKRESPPFSQEELNLLGIASMHLGNCYCNFFLEPPSDEGDTLALRHASCHLTDREVEIGALLLRGNTPKRIADRLGISRTTVYKHVANMHEKLGVSSQAELLARLREMAR